MGPRPPRPGSAVSAAQALKPVEVVRVRSQRPVEPPSTPLPPAMLSALASIARDMRDVPRDCIRDPAELVVWLRRMAGRVEGVGQMRVTGAALARPEGVQRTPAALPRPATPRDLAEALFGKGPAVARAPGPRTIISRRGQAVRVEVRRARAAGQMELGL